MHDYLHAWGDPTAAPSPDTVMADWLARLALAVPALKAAHGNLEQAFLALTGRALLRLRSRLHR